MSNLKSLIKLFTERGKVDIRRRVLRLVLFGSILTFALLSILSLIGIISTWNVINTSGTQLSESAGDYAEKFAEDQAHEQMLDTVGNKTRLIRLELQSIGEDVSFIAAQMHRIYSQPQDYEPQTLRDLRNDPVTTGEVYTFRSLELARNPVPAIEENMRLESNIANTLEIIANDYYDGYQATLSVGSKYNYVVCIDVDYGKIAPLVYSQELLDGYETIKRPWYTEAIEANKMVFTDFYGSANGYPVINCSVPYYDTEGVAGVVSIGCSLNSLYDLVVDANNTTGEIDFVIDNKGRVIVSSRPDGIFEAGTDNSLLNDENLNSAVEKMLTGAKGIESITFDGKNYLLAFAPVQGIGWYMGLMLETDQVIAPAKEARHNIEQQMDDFKSSFGNVFIVLMVIAVLMVLRVMRSLLENGITVAGNFVKPIEELSDGVRDIASGQFDKKLNIKTGDEIEHLAVCFNAMTDELQRYMSNLKKETAEKERIATELDVATEIQSSMLPREFDFGRTDFELFATMHAAKEVGGDFYDFYLVDDNHLVVTIADVSGKGIAAALFMVLSKTLLKNFAFTMTSSDDIGALMTFTNQQLCKNNDAMMFVTMFVGVLELNTGRFAYVNGGHNPPLVYRAAEDRFTYLNSSARNFALGLMEDADFEYEEIQLGAGDVIYLYTDGVTEALNEAEELYGEDRLEKCLNGANAKNISVEEILSAVKASIKEYVGNAEQSDDITMIGLKYRGGAHD